MIKNDDLFQKKISFLIQKRLPGLEMHFIKTFPLLCFIALSSCSHLQKPEDLSVTLKSEQVFEKNKSFEGLQVGGLSEIFFDNPSGYFFVLSDDKKNHRFYKLSLATKPHYKLDIKEQIFLKSPGHNRLKRNMDPEALILNGDQILIASEGQQIYKVHEPTQIFTFNQQAVLQKAWPVPPVFWKAEHSPQPPSFGQQENKGFESLTLNKQKNILWTATEKSLKQDLIHQKKALVRLSAFDIQNQKLRAQYAYALHNPKEGGLTALQFLKDKMFISLERVYKKKNNKGVNLAYLFLTDCNGADNVLPQIQLKKQVKTCSKTVLWDSSQSAVQVDNLEGLTLGPVRPSKNSSSKKQLLVLVSDNNFNEDKQKTQFLFFELQH